jgi:hypothetical protein
MPGDLLQIAEADYCYGVGTLVIRVIEVAAPSPVLLGATWSFVKGMEVAWNGQDKRVRTVLVRNTALNSPRGTR